MKFIRMKFYPDVVYPDEGLSGWSLSGWRFIRIYPDEILSGRSLSGWRFIRVKFIRMKVYPNLSGWNLSGWSFIRMNINLWIYPDEILSGWSRLPCLSGWRFIRMKFYPVRMKSSGAFLRHLEPFLEIAFFERYLQNFLNETNISTTMPRIARNRFKFRFWNKGKTNKTMIL